MPVRVGPTEFAILQTVGQETNLPIEPEETIVNFSRAGQNQMRMVISVLFTPASIGIDPAPGAEIYSVIDFVNSDVYLSGAPQFLTTRFNADGQAVFNFTAEDLTVISSQREVFD